MLAPVLPIALGIDFVGTISNLVIYGLGAVFGIILSITIGLAIYKYATRKTPIFLRPPWSPSEVKLKDRWDVMEGRKTYNYDTDEYDGPADNYKWRKKY